MTHLNMTWLAHLDVMPARLSLTSFDLTPSYARTHLRVTCLKFMRFSFSFLRHAMRHDSFMYSVTYFAHLDATHARWSWRQKTSASWIILPFCSPMKAAPTRYASRSLLLLLWVCFGIHLRYQRLEASRHFAHTRRLHWWGITPRSFRMLFWVSFDTSLGLFYMGLFYICATRIIHTCDMTNSWVWHDPFTWCGMAHSLVWHDSFICVTWLIHLCDLCDITFWHVGHDSFTYMTWHIYMCDVDHSHVGLVTWHINMCDMIHSYVRRDSFICVSWARWSIHMCDMTHSYVWHDSCICVTWLIHMCDMTYSYVRHNLFTCGTWLIHICDITHSFAWHDSFIRATCVTWPIYMCDMTHSYVWYFLLIYVTWLIHISDMNPSHVQHYSFIYMICLIHMCHVTYPHMAGARSLLLCTFGKSCSRKCVI